MTGPLQLFGSALRQRKWQAGGILALTAINVTAVLLVPWPFKWIIDDVIGTGDLPVALAWVDRLSPAAQITLLAVCGLLARVVAQLASVASTVLGQRTGQGLRLDIARRVFSHLQQLDEGFFVQSRKGDLNTRIVADSAFAANMLSGVILPCLLALFTAGGIALTMWSLSPLLCVATVVSALPIPFIIAHFQRPIPELSFQQSNEMGGLMSLAEQALSSLPVIQGFNRQAATDEAYRQKAGALVAATLDVRMAAVRINVSVGLVEALVMAGFLVLAGWLVTQGALTIGALVVMIGYLEALYGPIGALAGVSTAYSDSLGKARRVIEVLDRGSAVRDRPDAVAFVAGASPPALALNDVHFGYHADRPILTGASATIASGEVVALVGPTGAGKSTIAALLTRSADPLKGGVTLDGTDLRRLQGDSLRRQIAIVLQGGGIIPATVQDNIAMFDPRISREAVVEAARVAQADAFVGRLEHGYDTLIGPTGVGLSGGQQQRIAIARAVAKNAPVLILDEPTSALDVETEARLFEALAAASRGRTTLLITHRSSTLQLADRILRLQDGQLREVSREEALVVQSAASL